MFRGFLGPRRIIASNALMMTLSCLAAVVAAPTAVRAELKARRQEWNGGPVRLPGTARAFIIDGGRKREFADLPAFQNLYEGDPATVVQERSELSQLQDGPVIDANTFLISGSRDPQRIFLFDRGVKRAIPGWPAFYAYGFQKEFARILPQAVCDAIPLAKQNLEARAGGGLVAAATPSVQKSQALTVLQPPSFPIRVARGQKVDEADMYAEFTLTATGGWRLDTNMKATSNVVGSCGRFAVWLFDAAEDALAVVGENHFCVGTRMNIGGQKERDDHLTGSLDVGKLSRVRRVAILLEQGSKDLVGVINNTLAEARKVADQVKLVTDGLH